MIKTILSLFLAIVFFSCNKGKKEIIVIPDKFKGYILVIFNQKIGKDEAYRNGSRIYNIPTSGVLKTKFRANYSWSEAPEFYYNKINEKQKLPTYFETRKIPEGIIVGLIGSNGSANKDFEAKETVEFAFFYVGTKLEIEQYKEEAQKLDIIELAE
ncbi:hypothetical protein LX87_03444 [Larkinella arboricola]|uniref:DUF6843 domain-containing protein n=1 Tax=Larkinella arboricola TaxID=643671 RepID=A0A327WVI0_LARAB|nr:hypothetical protein [Larkinella arboricola]RAJ95696.1 hypothetical protein LX87_03444 [Larkinella arboricola]